MDKLDFLNLYTSNLVLNLLVTISSIFSTYLILRKQIYTIFDPLLFLIVLAGSGYSVVFILYYNNLISEFYFISFLTTQFSFFVGFKLNKRPRRNALKKLDAPIPYYDGTIKIIYPTAFFMFFFSQLYVYHVSGIPLFLTSRLEIFSGGDGYGFFNRIIIVSQIISVSVAFYRLFFIRSRKRIKAIDYFVIVFSLLVAVLSGSKSSILFIIFSMAFIFIFISKFNVDHGIFRRVNAFFYKLLLLGVAGAFVTIVYQTDNNDLSYIASVLAMRFVNTGDIYFMSYVNNTLVGLEQGNFILALFKDYFGAFRLMSWEQLPTNLGLQVFWSVYSTDLISGPNPRHNVFGLFYLGPYLSVVYSFFVGFMISFIRNKLLRRMPATPACMVFYVLIAANTIYIEQDTTFALGQYLSVFMVFIPIWAVSTLIQLSQVKPTVIKVPENE